ncbi:Uncharacterized protein SCF082_LOCUS34316, partial [Durusdinium trenchii]
AGLVVVRRGTTGRARVDAVWRLSDPRGAASMGNCCAGPEDNGPHMGLDSATQESDQLAPQELPAGWKAVPSRSRPGKVAYQNIHTGERISWVPTEEAKTYKGGINKKKRKKPKTGGGAPSGGTSGEENGTSGNTTVKTATNGVSKDPPSAKSEITKVIQT